MRANKLSTSHWRQTSFDVCSIYQNPMEHYQMRMKVFAIASSLLLYRPHILILGKRMRLFAIRSVFIWYIVVVTKKPPMCQIMCFSLCCINGSIKSKYITLKSSNNTLLAMKLELHTEEFLLLVHLPLLTHSCNKMITQNSTHRRFFRDNDEI